MVLLVLIYAGSTREKRTPVNNGEVNHPQHAIMECPAHEDLRQVLDLEITKRGIACTWNFHSCMEDLAILLKTLETWKKINARRNL